MSRVGLLESQIIDVDTAQNQKKKEFHYGQLVNNRKVCREEKVMSLQFFSFPFLLMCLIGCVRSFREGTYHTQIHTQTEEDQWVSFARHVLVVLRSGFPILSSPFYNNLMMGVGASPGCAREVGSCAFFFPLYVLWCCGFPPKLPPSTQLVLIWCSCFCFL